MLDNFKFFQIFAITDPQTGTAAATGGTTNGKSYETDLHNSTIIFINISN